VVLEDQINKVQYKNRLTYKESLSLMFGFFGILEKQRIDFKIFGKISFEDKVAPTSGGNPLEILNLEGVSVDHAREVDKKKDQIRRKLDNKIGKILKEIFGAYTLNKNLTLEQRDGFDQMQEKE